MLSHVRPVAPEKGCHGGAGGVFWIKVMTVFTTCLPFVSEVLSRSSRGFDSVCQTLSPTSVYQFCESIKEYQREEPSTQPWTFRNPPEISCNFMGQDVTSRDSYNNLPTWLQDIT